MGCAKETQHLSVTWRWKPTAFVIFLENLFFSGSMFENHFVSNSSKTFTWLVFSIAWESFVTSAPSGFRIRSPGRGANLILAKLNFANIRNIRNLGPGRRSTRLSCSPSLRGARRRWRSSSPSGSSCTAPWSPRPSAPGATRTGPPGLSFYELQGWADFYQLTK